MNLGKSVKCKHAVQVSILSLLPAIVVSQSAPLDVEISVTEVKDEPALNLFPDDQASEDQIATTELSTEPAITANNEDTVFSTGDHRASYSGVLMKGNHRLGVWVNQSPIFSFDAELELKVESITKSGQMEIAIPGGVTKVWPGELLPVFMSEAPE